MHNYLELKIWQHSRSLVKQINLITDTFPKSQQYGLTNQMQRAAVSIPSDIAEGAGRNSSKEFIHFLDIANGTAFELETQLFLTLDIGFSSLELVNPIINKLNKLQRMIFKFRHTIELKS